ncbi:MULTISPECIES: type II toxin-antitoxin system RelE/ParE family toxin [unclassified Thioalkalivibrio]|uniref:type II toxin-antitoxin system RelE/ParE family toxin n=1 Tax=unclassified Thioalkalivibrio TaxID=2621013 RepID=UPI0003788835|nr:MULTISPECIES: type II toxin-antitoxin system RelE/ParE family toxin [unclassified Thioalkalivibrio]
MRLIELLDAAEEDLARGAAFYTSRSPGLGEYFLDALFSDIDSLLLYAGVHEQHHGFHRLLSRRFPFAIYYRVDDEIIRVYAILDCRQAPGHLATRLSDPDE